MPDATRPHDSDHLRHDLAQAMYAVNRAIGWINEWSPELFRTAEEQADLEQLIAARDHIYTMRTKLNDITSEVPNDENAEVIR